VVGKELNSLSYFVCVFVRADRDGLREPSQVETVQSSLLAALKTHCTGRYGRNGGVTVGRLLGQLVELRSVGQLAGELMMWRLQTASDSTEQAVLTRVVSAFDDHTLSYVST